MFLTVCSNPFAPPLGEINSEITSLLTERNTPNQVLQNFRFAYMFQDSLVYADLLDSGFVFIYYNPNLGEYGRYDSWDRDVELSTTGRIFRVFSPIHLDWGADIETDSTDRIAKITRNFELTLGNDIRIFGYAQFELQQQLDETWKIIRWQDGSVF